MPKREELQRDGGHHLLGDDDSLENRILRAGHVS